MQTATHSKGTVERVAWLVAMAINPLVLPPLLLSLSAGHAGASPKEILLIAFVSSVFFLIIPFSYLVALKKVGKIESLEARDRSKRSRPLFVGVFFLLSALPALWFATEVSRPIVMSIAGFTAFNSLALAVVTRRFKISLHAAAVTGFFFILLTIQILSGREIPGGMVTMMIAALIVPLVIWARLAGKAHTAKEVASGMLFGTLVTPLELLGLHELGIIF